ncbi:MAG: hypothetical protein WCV90_00630 [Candidatus Woesearchaeota archaeon]
MVNQQRLWSFIGMFIIALVISIPFYSADVLATSLQITHNSGAGEVEKFIDAKGDTWTVEALISGLEGGENTTITPEEVKININDNERSFNSCSDDALGVLCKYISPLSEGVKETSYKFTVEYTYPSNLGINKTASDSDDINADGSAPKITGLTASQDAEGKVRLDFQVSDKYEGKPFIGIKSIEVLDGESGQVLDHIENLSIGKESYSYARDRGTNGILETSLSGEGTKHVKVMAEDYFGHKTLNPPQVSFQGDFVDPVIVADSLNLTALDKFKGSLDQTTRMLVDVRETSTPLVYAYADQTSLDGNEANCVEDGEEAALWHCSWESVLIKGTSPSSIEFKIVAKDQNGNTVESKITKSYVEDITPPEATFFGPDRQYNGGIYIADGMQRIYLKIKEQGSGVDENTISANFGGITGNTAPIAPENCTKIADEGITNCYWDVDAKLTSSNTISITLFKLEDKAGNKGISPATELIVDNGAPLIEKLEFFGTSDSGDHNYFQSNDRIKIKATVSESSGLNFLVNLNDLVNDAESKFIETDKTMGLDPNTGWQQFTEENCQQKEQKWICVIETDLLKSGPQSNQRVQVMITDTAGNNAKVWPEAKNVEKIRDDGTYSFDLLGLDSEEKPDYWEMYGQPTPGIEFVDLDTTPVAYTRMPMTVKLSSDNSQARVLSIQLLKDSCMPKEGSNAPKISRSISYGGSFPEGQDSPVSLTLMLEFAPFDGRTLFAAGGNPAEYTCQVQIYSKVGKNALASAETQEVTVSVPFGFSQMGAVDENLAKLVDDAWNTDFMKFANALHYVNLAITWIKYILGAINIIFTVVSLFNTIQAILTSSADSVESNAFTAGAGGFFRGSCGVIKTGATTVTTFAQYIQVPLAILSCAPRGEGGYSESLGWYGKYQAGVLDTYNLYTGRTLLGVPATSLYDNLYLSIIGLCVPGVVYNLEKAREIHCRKIVCYGTEVPKGVATVESCNDLFDLQMCEYVWGPAFEFVPLLGAVQQIGKLVKSIFTSPVGLINIVEMALCGTFCFVKFSQGLLEACNWARALTKLLDIIESVIGVIKQPPTVTATPYCDMAKGIDRNKLTGGSQYGQTATPSVEELTQQVEQETSKPETTSAPLTSAAPVAEATI